MILLQTNIFWFVRISTFHVKIIKRWLNQIFKYYIRLYKAVYEDSALYIVIYNLLLIIQSKFNNFLLNLKEEEVFLTFLCLSLPSILSNDISWHAKLLKVLNNLAQFEFTLIIIVPKCKNPILRSYFHSHRRMTVV